MKCVKQIPIRSSGFVSILALVFLAIFAALSVTFFNATSLSQAQASNFGSTMKARMAAESGLQLLIYDLQHCNAPGSLRGQALLDSLAGKLKTAMNGTATLAGGQVTYNNSTISVPTVNLGNGMSFTGQLTLPAADAVRLTVVGQYVAGTGSAAMTMSRRVTIDLHPAWDQALAYGLCSKGPVQLGMNTDLSGVIVASDGSIFSAAPSIAVSCGSGHISGDVSVSTPGATTSLGGTRVDGAVRYNAPPVTMPTIDRTAYKSLATTVVDSATNFSSGTFKNIRIKANTNPVFGSVTLQGVVYIEAPNNIQFTNNVNFTGVMVADDPPANSPDTANYIYFKNNMTFNSVTQLPDTPEFAAVKQLQGSAILCPGFTMEFKNNMTSVGGIMALKALTAKNNLFSTVYGSLLIYGDGGLDFKNNSDLNFYLSGSAPPVGFGGHGKPALVPDAATYVEN